MAKIEIKVDSVRQALLRHSSFNYPWVVILKSKTSKHYLPIYISESQAGLIQKLLLDNKQIPVDSVLKDPYLPAEQISKDILEPVIEAPSQALS